MLLAIGCGFVVEGLSTLGSTSLNRGGDFRNKWAAMVG